MKKIVSLTLALVLATCVLMPCGVGMAAANNANNGTEPPLGLMIGANIVLILVVIAIGIGGLVLVFKFFKWLLGLIMFFGR